MNQSTISTPALVKQRRLEQAHTQGLVDTMLEDAIANDDPGAVRRELRACGFSPEDCNALIREAKRARKATERRAKVRVALGVSCG